MKVVSALPVCLVYSLVFAPALELRAAATPPVAVTARLAGRVNVTTALMHDRDFLIFSPDGSRVITAAEGFSPVVTIWRTAGGEPIAQVQYPGELRDLVLSPDGRLLVAADGSGKIICWSMSGGAPVHTLATPATRPTSVSFSTDGRWLAVGCDGPTVVMVWNTATWKIARQIKAAGSWCLGVAFSHGSRMLAGVLQSSRNLMAGKDLQIWGVPSWKPIIRHHLAVKGLLVRDLAFSPDDRRVVVATTEDEDLLDVRSWQRLEPSPGFQKLGSAAFSPGGGLFAAGGGEGGAIGIWSTQDWRLVCTLAGHTGGVHRVRFLPDGRTLATMDGEGVLRLWRLKVFAAPPRAKPTRAVDPQSQPALGALTTLAPANGPVSFSPSGTMLVTGDGSDILSRTHGIRLWDARSWHPVATPVPVSGRVDLTFSQDGRLAATIDNSGLRIWSLPDWKLLRALGQYAAVRDSFKFSPDGHLLVAGWSNQGINLLDTRTWTRIRTLQGSGGAAPLDFSPDGRLAAVEQEFMTAGAGPVDGGYNIEVWDSTIWKRVTLLKDAFAPLFSPDGRLLAAVQNTAGGGLGFWDTRTWKLIRTVPGVKDRALCFSPNGNWFATAGDTGVIQLRDAATGALVKSWKSHADQVVEAAFSPASTRLGTAGLDRTVRVWSIPAVVGRREK